VRALLSSPNFWRTLFGVVSGVVAYLLIQTEVPLDPVAKVALGAISIAVTVVKTPGTTNVSSPVLPEGTPVTVVTPEGEPNKVTTV